MATKAQEFRSEAQRTAMHKPPQHTPHKPEPGRRSHNEAHRAAARSSYALEDMGNHASRKSTRGSANRAKTDSVMRITAGIHNESPSVRSRRRSHLLSAQSCRRRAPV